MAEKIREQDRNVLIFFLSDRSDKSDRLKGFSVKGNDYLAKPFYPEELLARIRERFDQILRILACNLNKTVDRTILLKAIWKNDSYANSLALNVQITYLRKALKKDLSVGIVSLTRKGYMLKDIY